MSKKLLFIFAMMLAAYGAYAQGNRIDPSELDFGTNLEVPKVPLKQAADISDHMKNIKKALEKHSVAVAMERDDEVINITIPCSEMFRANDTIIKANGTDKLKLLSDLLKYPTMYKLVVAVYSDNTGESDYCDNLTGARANAIFDFLAQLANDQDINVIPYGMGQADPKVENNSIENRAANRRVEIFIIPEWQMIDTARAGKLKPKQ